jgi:hypothetical protein
MMIRLQSTPEARNLRFPSRWEDGSAASDDLEKPKIVRYDETISDKAPRGEWLALYHRCFPDSGMRYDERLRQNPTVAMRLSIDKVADRYYFPNSNPCMAKARDPISRGAFRNNRHFRELIDVEVVFFEKFGRDLLTFNTNAYRRRQTKLVQLCKKANLPFHQWPAPARKRERQLRLGSVKNNEEPFPDISAADFLVVVRTIGERTLPVLLQRLEQHFASEDIHVVKKTPFFEAVRETFRIGARNPHKRFLFALDADVVLNFDFLEKVIHCAENMNPYTTLRTRMLVRDKYENVRDCGNHMYSNRWSESVLAYIDISGEREIPRPESTNVARFSKTVDINSEMKVWDVIGDHGFEQFYHHLYMSMYNRFIKVKPWRKEYITQSVKQKLVLYPNDYDYKIARDAIDRAFSETRVILDQKRYPSIETLLRSYGIEEKENIIAEHEYLGHCKSSA